MQHGEFRDGAAAVTIAITKQNRPTPKPPEILFTVYAAATGNVRGISMTVGIVGNAKII